MQNRLLVSLLFLPLLTFSQLPVTLEDCFETYKFYPQTSPSLRFLKDGQSFLERKGPLLIRKSILSGDSLGVFFDKSNMSGDPAVTAFSSFQLSEDESKMLLATDVRPIYRHSFSADFSVFDMATGKTEPLDPGRRQEAAMFSPDGSMVAWVRDNNLFIKELASHKIVQVTFDGEKNKVINGVPDWVYEEEFSSVTGAGMRAMAWSPDSRRLAWIRFDESKVPQMRLDYFEEGMYPRGREYKYPKVGEANSTVSVLIFDAQTGKTVKAGKGPSENPELLNLGGGQLPAFDSDELENEHYLPRINWTRDPNTLSITRLNRHQDRLKLLGCDVNTGNSLYILAEEAKTYVNVHDNLVFMPDGKSFLWTAENDGWNHIYLREIGSPNFRQLTQGKFEVTAFYGLDEKTGTIFYQTAQPTPMDRQVWSLNIADSLAQPFCLSAFPGTSEASFSPSFDFFKLDWSDANTPPRSRICDRRGKIMRQLLDNQSLIAERETHGFSKKTFFSFKTPDGTELNGWLMKPRDFDATRKHPVLMSVYGGPGSQEVLNSYDGFMGTYYQMLNQQGIVVACVDNRGTGGRGSKFRDETHLDLGKLEVADQIEAARYLGRQPWADPSRLGIWGWSYGGYMSANCIFKGNDVFKAAAAVAPVTNWKWYDSAYTERYLHTEKENQKGFDENSPINFADRLKGHFFLAHGLADDNVHWQNSAELSNALIKNNKQFEEHFYPNRDHGISGDGATMHLFWELTEFFMTKL